MRCVASRGVVLLAGILMLGGCAYVTAVPVTPDSPVEGIRIYDVKPILIVNDTSVTVQLVPNYSRPYALKFGTFLAKNDVQVDFENGFIKTLKTDQDTTAIIELLKTVASQLFQPGGGKAFSAKAEGGATGRFQVYEFVFDDLGNLVGLRPLLGGKTLMALPSKASASGPAPNTVPQPGGSDVQPQREQ